MKAFRNIALRRVLSVFFLLNLFQALIVPNISLALTGGPNQMEYTSYEEVGSTDMVNLLTGDFAYTLPLLEVPGPEGGFSVPLSYHAGIGLEQEASWVGLGWNINTGAILRNINQYPDDASGELNQVTVQDLTGVSGWATQYLGASESWNSLDGYQGAINLLDIVEVDWGKKSSVGIVGFHVGKDTYFDAKQFANAVLTIASMGANAAEEKGAELAIDGFQTAMNVALAFNSSSATSSSASGYWSPKYSSKTSWVRSKVWGRGIKTTYKYWTDQTRMENMFGAIYSGNAQYVVGTNPNLILSVNGQSAPFTYFQNDLQGSGSASDVNFQLDNSLSYNRQPHTPTVLALDDYNVNAPSVSGSISPYRLDIGSVATPRQMTAKHYRYGPVPYLNNYKVPFCYKGSIANSYFHHVGGATAVTDPTYYFGMSLSTGNQNVYTLNDVTFLSQRIRSDITPTDKIPQDNNIDWFTNDEIKTSPYPVNFMDVLPSSLRSAFRTGFSPKSIGGYSITAANGTTYHFALPICDYNQNSTIAKISDSGKNSSITRANRFANTWVLTGITGSDFVDRNQNGQIDDFDWGYWVKFNYGQYSDNFNWRNPYTGYKVDPTGIYSVITSGQKQMYYLNSIETRSHVALFLKSPRTDGKSAITGGAYVYPLKLDEICLVKKEIYKQMHDGYGIPDYSADLSSICLSSQFASASNFKKQNCLKQVLFTYGYDLCQNTPNSDTGGKLTLERLSFLGRNGFKVIPDYLFEYSNNPNYNVDQWDGWGMYSSQGTSSAFSHAASTNHADGSAWSLTKITTPLGSTVNMNYERDDYGSISGTKVSAETSINFSNSNYSVVYPSAAISQLKVSDPNLYAIGDQIQLFGSTRFNCGGTSYTTNFNGQTFTVQAKGSNYIDFGVDFNQFGSSPCNSGQNINVESQSGYTYRKVFYQKDGGNLRVGSISMTNDVGGQNKIRYLYQNDDGSSSGVISQEPDYIKTLDLSFYKLLRYPTTPVMYGKVSVLTGALSDDSDYASRQVYEFETPDASLLSSTEEDHGGSSHSDYTVEELLYKIEDRTSKIGRLKSIRTYNSTGILSAESLLSYVEQIPNDSNLPYQGVYSEGTLLSDWSQDILDVNNPDPLDAVYRLNRTTVLTYPYVLKKVTNNKDGLSFEHETLNWDFSTGNMLEQIDRTPDGLNTKTVVKPAYRVYSEFGSKAVNPSYKNMVGINAETYRYKSDANGNVLGLIDAQVQTWRKDWSNYRVLSAGVYGENQAADGTPNPPVWRKSATYSWKGTYSKLQPDGTRSFLAGDDFNFTNGASNPGWQKVGEITRYDHYSTPLESFDLNGVPSGSIRGYSNSYPIASSANAQYTEMAFSGAEDLDGNTNYFGGEVARGSGSVNQLAAHSGSSSLSLSSGTGFVFTSSILKPNRTYRASVWTSTTDGRLYYNLNGAGSVPSAAPIVSQQVVVGTTTWYLLNFEIPVGSTFSSIEVGVESLNGTSSLFDDFRFQPADASMTCYVYDPSTMNLTYTLDNDNLYTRFVYNDGGLLTQTYKETLRKGGERLLSEKKYNYKRFNTNQ